MNCGPKRAFTVVDDNGDLLLAHNCFVWQFNPLKDGLNQVRPFILWDFQEAALLATPEKPYIVDVFGHKQKIETGIKWCFENNKTCVVEKSREMGASWLFLIFQDWLCLTREYTQTLNISHTEKAVENSTPNALFWKIGYMHDHYPEWLCGEITHHKLRFKFHRTKAGIYGESSTGRAGVGGRARIIFIDEFSQIVEDRAVRQGTASTSDCRFFNGTHLGLGTEFFNLTESPEICKIRMHWSMHPDKRKGMYISDPSIPHGYKILDTDFEYPEGFEFVTSGKPTGGPFPGLRSPWYDNKCLAIGTERGIAMELDIDPKGSSAQFFNPTVIAKLLRTVACDPYWRGDIVYDSEGRFVKLSSRPDGPLKLWTTLNTDGRVQPASYGIGGDISTGIGASPSVLTIVNGETGEKVGEYTNSRIFVENLAPLAVAMCWLFKDKTGQGAKICWEDRGPGTKFGIHLYKELGYHNVYWRESESEKYGGKASKNKRPGFSPDSKAKRLLLENYETALRLGEFTNRSEQAIQECLSFEWTRDGRGVKHGKETPADDPLSANDNHADHVIADALAWKVCQDIAKVAKKEVENHLPINSLAFRRQLHEYKSRQENSWI